MAAGVLWACLEVYALIMYPEGSKAAIRLIYDGLWKIAPKPDGYVPPDQWPRR